MLRSEESHSEVLGCMYSLNFKGRLYWNISKGLNNLATNSKHHFENCC